MSCEFGNWSCELGEAVGQWVGGATGQALVAIAQALADGLGQLVRALGTMWIAVPTPKIVENQEISSIGNSTAGVVMMLNWASWLALIVCILSLIGFGATLGLRRGNERIRRLGSILLAVVMVSGAGSIVGYLVTSQNTEASPAIGFIHESLQPLVMGLAVLSLIIAAIRTAWEQRADGARQALSSLLTLAVVTGGGLTAVAVLVAASDALASEILANSSTGGSFEENLLAMLGVAHVATGGSGVLIVIVLGTVALCGSIVQIGLMVLRSGMLVLLAGILPLSASFTNTAVGANWFRKCIGWLLAFILYKPAAALIYATAFQLVGTDLFASDGTGIWAGVAGVAMMLMALLALPALMRFVAPVMALQAGGAGLGASMARVGAEVPTGAVRAFQGSRSHGTAAYGGSAATGSSGAASGSGAGGAALGGATAAGGVALPAVAAAGTAIAAGQKAADGVKAGAEQAASAPSQDAPGPGARAAPSGAPEARPRPGT